MDLDSFDGVCLASGFDKVWRSHSFELTVQYNTKGHLFWSNFSNHLGLLQSMLKLDRLQSNSGKLPLSFSLTLYSQLQLTSELLQLCTTSINACGHNLVIKTFLLYNTNSLVIPASSMAKLLRSWSTLSSTCLVSAWTYSAARHWPLTTDHWLSCIASNGRPCLMQSTHRVAEKWLHSETTHVKKSKWQQLAKRAGSSIAGLAGSSE